MRTVITYGTFDLLHRGHLRLLERARTLGDRLIVGVTSDQFDRARGKLNVVQSTLERVDAVRSTGLADLIVIEEYEGQKIDDVKRYEVDVFTVGSDWAGSFDYLREYCEVIYLERTEGVSSTEIRSEGRHLTMGLVGDVPYLSKFLRESLFVDGVEVTGVCARTPSKLTKDLRSLPLVTSDYSELLSAVDSVYLITHPSERARLIREAIEARAHILCESPIALDRGTIRELFLAADEKEVKLVEALRTAHSPAYHHLQLLVESGVIGRVVAVDATCTSLRPVDATDPQPFASASTWGSILSWGPAALLPALQILGTRWDSKIVASILEDETTRYDSFTRIVLAYPGAVATATVGSGAKSEGQLVVSGTRGYVLVPAPWWKTDYFEVRYENQTDNRRYYWQLEGEGIRELLIDFARAVRGEAVTKRISHEVSMAVAGVLEDFVSGKDFVQLS